MGLFTTKAKTHCYDRVLAIVETARPCIHCSRKRERYHEKSGFENDWSYGGISCVEVAPPFLTGGCRGRGCFKLTLYDDWGMVGDMTCGTFENIIGFWNKIGVGNGTRQFVDGLATRSFEYGYILYYIVPRLFVIFGVSSIIWMKVGKVTTRFLHC